MRAGAPATPRSNISHDDLSAIIYTSGTTGRPKGVPVTHRQTYARFSSHVMTAGPLYDSGVRTLGSAPLYHAVGLHWVLCLTVFVNGTYFPVRRLDGPELVDLIERERLTFLLGAPPLYHALVAAAGERDRDLTCVREASFGSAPMPPSLRDELVRLFPHATITELFGSTEMGGVFATVDVPRHKRHALRVTVDHRARIVRPGGAPDEVLPPDETGELIVDGSSEGAFDGYWRDPELTARRFRDDWYYTGDAFTFDGEGNYFAHGRLDDMFISGGENVQPVEIEALLASCPGILDVAVIGTPDPRWGETVTALVVRAVNRVSETGIDRFCRESDLADFKRPRRVLFVDEIERDPSGKIARQALRERHRAHWDTLESE